MHDNEFPLDLPLVRQLIATQFPHWADLPLRTFPSSGTDNLMVRLGEEMVIRLPRIPSAAEQVAKEQRWLPFLAPQLPLAIPTPLAHGRPAADYPWGWSIYRWFVGENATSDKIQDMNLAAADLAAFVVALRAINPGGGPPPGSHNSFRGVPLADRDGATRLAIASLHGKIDQDAATAAWEHALNAAVWDLPPVWIHGDLQSGNLLARAGRLTAVIDFGVLGIGDPACDLAVAWNLFGPEARTVFQANVDVDEASWNRGRGWALSIGLIALPYYEQSNPALAAVARQAIEQVTAEFKADI